MFILFLFRFYWFIKVFYIPSSSVYRVINGLLGHVYRIYVGRLRGLAVAYWITDHYHPCSNTGVGISEGCFVFRFVSLPLEVARPI